MTEVARERTAPAECRARSRYPLPNSRRARLKRVVDLIIAVPLFVLSLPIIVLALAAVFLVDRGNPVFTQTRVGQGGRTIRIHKIRTMHHDAEARLHSDPTLYDLYMRSDFKLPARRDPRVTRLGRILRCTSVDELPQLVDVIAGRMSMVGPRPVVLAEVDCLYGGRRELYESMLPGLTGLWQVSGRSTISDEGRVALDLDYERLWSPWLDLQIVLRTPAAVLTGVGAH